MLSPMVVQRLEGRAKAAEQLILLLKSRISQIRSCQSSAEVTSLREENDRLKKEIEVWRKRLVDAEIANGVLQVPSSSNKPREPVPQAVAAPVVPASENALPEKVEKEKKKKPPAEKNPPAEEEPIHVGRLDMRVGLIRKATRHPDADALYVEEVDVGEEKPRTVISGLVKFIPEDQMQNRMAILLCNLKPAKMRGINSEAMVMCASTPEKVEILTPPEGSKPGDMVEVEGFLRNPDAQLNPKKKIFETCAPDLKVNGDRVATFRGVPWTIDGKNVLSQTLVNVQIK